MGRRPGLAWKSLQDRNFRAEHASLFCSIFGEDEKNLDNLDLREKLMLAARAIAAIENPQVPLKIKLYTSSMTPRQNMLERLDPGKMC